MKDLSKYSKASKARWAGVPAEVRKERMSAVVRVRWGEKSLEERKAIMLEVRKARAKKNSD